MVILRKVRKMARKKRSYNYYQKKYGPFLGAMEKRLGNKFTYDSDRAKALVDEADRLNLSDKQFLRNYEYWLAHVEDLERAEPIDRASGVKPSDYAKQLGLPKIKQWNKEQEENAKKKRTRTARGGGRKARG